MIGAGYGRFADSAAPSARSFGLASFWGGIRGLRGGAYAPRLLGRRPVVKLALLLLTLSFVVYLVPVVATTSLVTATFLLAFGRRYASRAFAEREALARLGERQYIARELHDTVKQSARGTSMMIAACLEVHRKGNHEGLGQLLGQALKISQDTNAWLSAPLDGLDETEDAAGEDRKRITRFRESLEKLAGTFGLDMRTDLRASLERLGVRELLAAERICTEACWNAIKHSRASSLVFESLRDGPSLVLRVRDDGIGFRPERAIDGLGLSSMRSRAEEVGAKLDLISDPGLGTVVELRFGGR